MKKKDWISLALLAMWSVGIQEAKGQEKVRALKMIVTIALGIALMSGCQRAKIEAEIARNPQTFCNPVNVDYRFMVIDGGDGIREAADPVVVQHKGKYLLFASKSSGYWVSSDFVDWNHVIITDSVLPIEDYAPGIFVHNDYVYYVGSTHGKGMLYRTNEPETGKWEKVKEIWSYWDPAFFVEGDNLYMYYGCSPSDPIYAQVLDLNTLEAKSEVIACLNSDKEQHGWERTGELNELPRRPYIEGAWMTKNGNKYYLQYAGPGTEWKSYADGVYVGDSPMGPFTYVDNNPVSYKPSGFIGGAGHGCLFQAGDQWWKAATNAICVRHMFERRVSFYPSGFDADGYFYTDTYLGDYPMFLPATDRAKKEVRPDWMLLSYRKSVTVSSALPNYPAENATDEEARTAWVAESNDAGEWLQVDLGDKISVSAIQVNYDEYGATQKGVNPSLHQSYVIYASNDGREWFPIVDYSQKRTDNPHDYIEFAKAFDARYIKWENKEYNIANQVSLRELRVFGKGNGDLPSAATDVSVKRNMSDPCKVIALWGKSEGADGYILRYGIAKDKLYSSMHVLNKSSVEITSLNKGVTYYFVVDAYNENGLVRGQEITILN